MSVKVDAVIEDPKGATRRHVLDPVTGVWSEYEHPHTAQPWPASYGFLPGTYNVSDNDELDVLVLASAPLATGTRVKVRPVALLRRPDGDHKILATASEDPEFGWIERLAEIPQAELDAIERWFRAWTNFAAWRDESEACELIRQAVSAAAGKRGV